MVSSKQLIDIIKSWRNGKDYKELCNEVLGLDTTLDVAQGVAERCGRLEALVRRMLPIVDDYADAPYVGTRSECLALATDARAELADTTEGKAPDASA